MKRPSLRLGLGMLLTLVLAAVAVQPALSNPVDHPWAGSGSGTTTVVSDGSAGPAVFQYQDLGEFSGSWNFSTTASTTRTVNLTYDYTGFNAFFAVTVGLEAYVTHETSTTTTSLVNAGPVDCCTPPSGGFTYSGSVTLSVQAGDTYGFMLQGSNFDSNMTLQGTLTVDEPCTQTITGAVPGPLHIAAGITCINGGSCCGAGIGFGGRGRHRHRCDAPRDASRRRCRPGHSVRQHDRRTGLSKRHRWLSTDRLGQRR